MHISICKIDDQCKFDAGSTAVKAGALGHPEGWVGREVRGVQDRETHVHPLVIHLNTWQKPPKYC